MRFNILLSVIDTDTTVHVIGDDGTVFHGTVMEAYKRIDFKYFTFEVLRVSVTNGAVCIEIVEPEEEEA